MDSICEMNLPDKTGDRTGDFIAIDNVLSLIDSVCCCIPIFPCKCGGHLKESHKSVVKRASSTMAGSVKKCGTALRNRASPATPEAVHCSGKSLGLRARGLEPEPWPCHLQAGYLQASLTSLKWELGGLNEIH